MPTFDTPGPITVNADLLAGELRVVAGDRPDTIVHVRPAEETEERDRRAAEQTRVELVSGTLTIRGPLAGSRPCSRSATSTACTAVIRRFSSACAASALNVAHRRSS